MLEKYEYGFFIARVMKVWLCLMERVRKKGRDNSIAGGWIAAGRRSEDDMA
jgi:hypothetical protein